MARTATATTAPPTTDTATQAATTDATDTTDTTAPAPNAAALAELREIAVADIATDGSNPRTLFDLDGEAGLRELAASIKAHGLVQPITVRANLDAGGARPPTCSWPASAACAPSGTCSNGTPSWPSCATT